MSIGLDLGSTQFRSLRRSGDRLVGRLCRPIYLSIPDHAGIRRLLEREQTPFFVCEDQLVVVSDAAVEWASVLRTPLQHLLPDGQLPAHDPLSRQILTLMLDAVLPPAASPRDVCCLTIPGELLPDEAGPERQFFSRLVTLRGYQTVMIGQGLAVALSELSDVGLTGIGISLGASQCEFALVHRSQELARCAIPWGLSELCASEEGQETAAGHLQQTSPPSHLLVDFLVELLLEAGLRIEQHDGFRLLTQPVTLACAGGITAHPEFDQIWHQAWQRAAWPLQVREHRLTRHATYTVALGCLIQAQLHSVIPQVRAA